MRDRRRSERILVDYTAAAARSPRMMLMPIGDQLNVLKVAGGQDQSRIPPTFVAGSTPA